MRTDRWIFISELGLPKVRSRIGFLQSPAPSSKYCSASTARKKRFSRRHGSCQTSRQCMSDFEPVIKKERGLLARSTDRRLKPASAAKMAALLCRYVRPTKHESHV